MRLTPKQKTYLPWIVTGIAAVAIIWWFSTLTGNDWTVIALVVFSVSVLGFIGIAIGGATNMVVIYYDYKDLFISGGTLLLLMLAGGCACGGWSADSIVLKVLLGCIVPMGFLLAGLACGAKNYTDAISHTRSKPLGILIGTFKIIFSFWAMSSLLDAVGDITNTKTKVGKKFWALAWIGIVIAITKSLVNGKSVYQKKGWTQPVPWRSV